MSFAKYYVWRQWLNVSINLFGWNFSSQKLDRKKPLNLTHFFNDKKNITKNDFKNNVSRTLHNAHIGLNDIEKEGDFKWVIRTDDNKTSASWWPWWSGQPDNWSGNEDCVELRSNGYWNDFPCNSKFNYICQTPLSESFNFHRIFIEF